MLGQPKQKSKEEDARKKRDRHKTGGGCTVSAQSEQVIAVASHIMTRVGNQSDSDGGIDLPPVASLPVIRLLQPMVDGAGNEEFHYAETRESDNAQQTSRASFLEKKAPV
ncbi:uncharacterized protein LOC144098224 [Amblyomma americanum]